MTTKVTELVDKLVCAEWCPIREYAGLVALASKVRNIHDLCTKIVATHANGHNRKMNHHPRLPMRILPPH